MMYALAVFFCKIEFIGNCFKAFVNDFKANRQLLHTINSFNHFYSFKISVCNGISEHIGNGISKGFVFGQIKVAILF